MAGPRPGQAISTHDGQGVSARCFVCEKLIDGKCHIWTSEISPDLHQVCHPQCCTAHGQEGP